jgi:hypothetical protein
LLAGPEALMSWRTLLVLVALFLVLGVLWLRRER